jgi:BlaI family penicillinase repressor
MPRKRRQISSGRADLTPLEADLMQVLWERGDANAAEVGEALKEKRPLAPTTICTVLANLRKKGYLKLVPTVERSLRYAPSVPREQVGGRRLQNLLRDFFGGSPRRLMAHLINEGSMSEAELAGIRKLLESVDRKEGERE